LLVVTMHRLGHKTSAAQLDHHVAEP